MEEARRARVRRDKLISKVCASKTVGQKPRTSRPREYRDGHLLLKVIGKGLNLPSYMRCLAVGSHRGFADHAKPCSVVVSSGIFR
eukprot:2668137-Amphidinium_carterae.2